MKWLDHLLGFDEWHNHHTVRPVLDVNDTLIAGMVMRRRASDGSWQYRALTEDERKECSEWFAW